MTLTQFSPKATSCKIVDFNTDTVKTQHIPFHSSQGPLMLHFVGTPSLSHPHPLLTPSSYLIVLLFSNFVISVMLYNGNHIAGGFSNWLLSLNIIPWRAIWVVCNICLFLLLLSRYSILWIYHIFKTSHLLKDFLGVIIN